MAGEQTVETHGHIPMEHSPHHRSYEEGAAREDITFFPVPNYPEYRWAMADRPGQVHRLFGVRGGVLHREQRARWWDASSTCAAARCRGSASSRTTRRTDRRETSFPRMCQHCDYAPCEPVCPVYATYHNDEGLNVQVYNRCVGTRYCANNCPYKVAALQLVRLRATGPHPLNLMINPTCRCAARASWRSARSACSASARPATSPRTRSATIREGDVTPACAQACPGKAIVFGNLLDDELRGARVGARTRARRASSRNSAPARRLLPEEGGTAPWSMRRAASAAAAHPAAMARLKIERDVISAMQKPGLLYWGLVGLLRDRLRRVPARARGATRSTRASASAASMQPGRLGYLHRQLRLLGRYRALGDADLGGAVPVPLQVPQQLQPRRPRR